MPPITLTRTGGRNAYQGRWVDRGMGYNFKRWESRPPWSLPSLLVEALRLQGEDLWVFSPRIQLQRRGPSFIAIQQSVISHPQTRCIFFFFCGVWIILICSQPYIALPYWHNLFNTHVRIHLSWYLAFIFREYRDAPLTYRTLTLSSQGADNPTYLKESADKLIFGGAVAGMAVGVTSIFYGLYSMSFGINKL